ncbi:glycosyltransferase family 4 protein [Candidatus Epulonipiscium viviparus]|uniref:glycosyltransferase family 4 protein n=1 Tax=Candidatus Epulonipiscium viviparus TaxID=420336 RepID=UPI0027380E69|nr:glycosyltransferase family 4 protein [Candidatus Epulopiscium viviparus]
MIKILHVCSDTNIGGAGRYLLNLYNANAAGLDLYFLLPTQSKLAAVLAAAGANVIELDIAKDASWAAKDIYKIARLLKRLRPDIVHTHANFTARVSAKLVGIGKIVYTRHYVETAASAPNKLKRWLNNFLCDAVIIALIAGEGPEEENIRELIRQKNLDEDTIRIVGFVENVSDILNVTDIILNTSTTEAKSLSLLEAMSIGIPAVVSNVGGNPSLIANAENGFVVEQADADGFVARIADLLSDADLYAAMSANAINRFNQNHHAHQMVAKTKNFYEKKENNIEEI